MAIINECAGFDPTIHLARKYGTTELDWLSPGEYAAGIEQIRRLTLQALTEREAAYGNGEHQDRIMGVFLFGSWTRRTVHSLSDIDVWLIREGYDVDGGAEEFIDLLRDKGLPQVEWDDISISQLNLPYCLAWELRATILSNGHELITPHECIVQAVNRAKSPCGTTMAEIYQKHLYSEFEVRQGINIPGL